MTVVDVAIAHGVMTITLDDVDRRNALSQQLLREFLDAIDGAEGDPAVRAVVVTNQGTVFCAGANLAERSSPPGTDVASAPVDLSTLLARISRSPLPFVGRINGHCVAGGVGLAAVMDISVAVDSALFGFTEVRVGVAPAMISVVCLPKMRLGDARAAFLRGQRFSATEAERLGLINQVTSSDDLDAAITAIVNDLLSGEPGALSAAKLLTNTVPGMAHEDAFDWTTTLSAHLFASDEAREGMTAFLEKRPASWVQRLPDSTL
ncbi:MAG: enoyl-CoA hydratase [Acidobacteria bacterium]|nr:enoyl-CoA hydratase [Acidobacteriota bacterium]